MAKSEVKWEKGRRTTGKSHVQINYWTTDRVYQIVETQFYDGRDTTYLAYKGTTLLGRFSDWADAAEEIQRHFNRKN